jgi:hypothetical protein
MSDDYQDKCSLLRDAIYQALEVLGKEARVALLFHLKQRLNTVSLSDDEEEIPCAPLADIEVALRGLLGPAAEIIIKRIRKSLKSDGVTA